MVIDNKKMKRVGGFRHYPKHHLTPSTHTHTHTQQEVLYAPYVCAYICIKFDSRDILFLFWLFFHFHNHQHSTPPKRERERERERKDYG